MKVFESFVVASLGFIIVTVLSDPQPNNESIAVPILYVYAVFFSPIFEEIICRKAIQDQLNKHIKTNSSILISGFIFATLHFNLSLFVGYFFIGLVWGYYYKKTGNIFVPIFSHFLFNYFALLIQSF
ncbi:CPBP family intramembrane glutamic endopeptidase [Paenibacillus lautus]|uniref:CPBP family intramembrane glutamic endopeptidase n=1 Tax=Paenibacillus lautus TaxID=1401 RepID=UPI001C7D725C|nr:CPBP family intramembrane glutamic endopeptidase [Paenibacillus lautus]MBX4152442.1 CPBP family intramembrane metalloprotease [Paenibacillus lautus]